MDDCGGYRALPFVAEFYPHIQAYHDPLSQVFYRGLARAARGPVLELGCGAGRLLIPMARTGAPATGLDLSEAMLAQCRTRLAHEPPDVQARVHLVHGDMRDFSLPRPYRLVTIPFLTFMHLLTVDEQLACLSAAHRHLEPGGRLALDVFNPDLRALTDARMGRGGPGGAALRLGRRSQRDPPLPRRLRRPPSPGPRLLRSSTPSPTLTGDRSAWCMPSPTATSSATSSSTCSHAPASRSRRSTVTSTAVPVGATYPGELIVVARKP